MATDARQKKEDRENAGTGTVSDSRASVSGNAPIPQRSPSQEPVRAEFRDRVVGMRHQMFRERRNQSVPLAVAHSRE